MLTYDNGSLNLHQRMVLEQTKQIHLSQCKPCFDTFNRVAYYTVSDFTFVGIIFHEMYHVSTKGEWRSDNNGNEYFFTNEFTGCKNDGSEGFGPCIQVHSGTSSLRGRNASKVYTNMLRKEFYLYKKGTIFFSQIETIEIFSKCDEH